MKRNHISKKELRDRRNGTIPTPVADPLTMSIGKDNDKLHGNYPMSKERLLELIELLPDGLMWTDNVYGVMVPQKPYLKTMLEYMQPSRDTWYNIYIESVKPYLPKK